VVSEDVWRFNASEDSRCGIGGMEAPIKTIV
jgi:hypothetical protein